MAWSLLLNSVPAHKEFRFLLPALQLLMPYAGAALALLAETLGQRRPSESLASGTAQRRDSVAADAKLLSPAPGASGADAVDISAAADDIDAAYTTQANSRTGRTVSLRSNVKQRAAHAKGVDGVDSTSTQPESSAADQWRRRGRRRTLLSAAAAAAALCLLAQLPAAAYFCLVHQR